MSVPWWQNRMAAFDIESTSTDVEEARIVTATVAFVGGGQTTDAFSVLVNPGIEIPEAATAIHGVSTERAQQEGVPPTVALPGVLSALTTAVRAGYAVVVYRAPYDLTVLDRECRRHGELPLPSAGLRVVDPFVIDRHLDRYRPGSRKLDAVCAHYGARLDGAHDAESDAVAAARVAWVIGHRGQVVRRVRHDGDRADLAWLTAEWERVRHNLDLLHEAQIGWAADQAAGLEEHFRRQGKTERVEREWPLVPFGAAQRPVPVPLTAPPESEAELTAPEWTR